MREVVDAEFLLVPSCSEDLGVFLRWKGNGADYVSVR